MNKKELKKMMNTFSAGNSHGFERAETWVLNHIIKETIDQNPDISDADLGAELRETVKAIKAIKISASKRWKANKIKKLKDDIKVYENTIASMKNHLSELQK
jgi:hypothetical protein